jgi:hypothetical protein
VRGDRRALRSMAALQVTQRLLDSGLTADAIAARTGFSSSEIDNLLRGADFWIPVKTVQQMLAMEVPPNT